jgi:hypothetical protein
LPLLFVYFVGARDRRDLAKSTKEEEKLKNVSLIDLFLFVKLFLNTVEVYENRRNV